MCVCKITYVLNALSVVEFIEIPTSRNATEGEVVKLNCTANATYIFWEVNGTILTSNGSGFNFTKTELLDTGIRTKILSVTASSYTNGASIRCVGVITHNIMNRSQPAALILVQGIINTSN